MAIVGLARALALEVAGSGVTVNVVVPGTVDTVRDEASALVTLDPERRLRAVPVGRLGTPDDVAGMCLFLASTEGSYMTGQEFFVTGGAYPLVSH
jgi:NAD(P)-dependent dehydrogenase (short-subunit alcohol dehydrogenase family)